MEKDWERAIHSGDVGWVRSLIEHGLEINSKDRHGQTGLMLAAMKGHTEIVRLLVENKAELNHTAKYHLSALMLAVINNHIEIVSLLAQAGADPSIGGTGAPGFAGLTALELAERAGYVEIAAILRGSGV